MSLVSVQTQTDPDPLRAQCLSRWLTGLRPLPRGPHMCPVLSRLTYEIFQLINSYLTNFLRLFYGVEVPGPRTLTLTSFTSKGGCVQVTKT